MPGERGGRGDIHVWMCGCVCAVCGCVCSRYRNTDTTQPLRFTTVLFLPFLAPSLPPSPPERKKKNSSVVHASRKNKSTHLRRVEYTRYWSTWSPGARQSMRMIASSLADRPTDPPRRRRSVIWGTHACMGSVVVVGECEGWVPSYSTYLAPPQPQPPLGSP